MAKKFAIVCNTDSYVVYPEVIYTGNNQQLQRIVSDLNSELYCTESGRNGRGPQSTGVYMYRVIKQLEPYLLASMAAKKLNAVLVKLEPDYYPTLRNLVDELSRLDGDNPFNGYSRRLWWQDDAA